MTQLTSQSVSQSVSPSVCQSVRHSVVGRLFTLSVGLSVLQSDRQCLSQVVQLVSRVFGQTVSNLASQSAILPVSHQSASGYVGSSASRSDGHCTT